MGRKHTAETVPHGTDAGYSWHMNYGVRPACDPCRLAHNAKMRERRARMVECKECGRIMQMCSRGRCAGCYERRRALSVEKKAKKAARAAPKKPTGS